MSKRTVPDGPVGIEEAIRRFPTLRQSLLGQYDDCNLSAYFELRYKRGWSTHPQARGTIFHRAAAEMLRTMQRQKMNSISVTEAREILLEVCRQQEVEPREIVRVPLRMMPELRMSVDKFARDNSFSIDRLVDVERRLSAPITYRLASGQKVVRELTGQLDAVIFEPPDGAIVLDWKDTFGLPPEPKEREPDAQRYEDDELKSLSYHGYFQQRFYGWLVMMNYANVQRVTLREFYVRKTKVRAATLHRGQLDLVEQELAILAEAFDRAIMQGSPAQLLKGDEEGYVDIDELGAWKPSPGKHCLGGETRIITDRGVRELADCEGERVRVLDRHGAWSEAEVRSFGRQPLVRVTFEDGSSVRATPDHRWWTIREERGSWRQTDERVTTMELERAPVALMAGIPDHAEPPRHPSRRVATIAPDGFEEVYCAVVPGAESFTLANGIITSNCGFCVRAAACPIEEEVRASAGAAATTPEEAGRWAARLQLAERIKAMAIDALKGYVETGGAPVPVKWSKGRRVIGWYKTKGGRRFGFFTPDDSERGGHAVFDEQLKQAMRESTDRARAARRPRAGKA